jgi:IclR family acetate operon transcriptional repressor
VGKLQLAFAPGDVVLGETFDAFTPATRATPEALAREVELARRRGFAENRDEWIPGLAVVAAPVLVAGSMAGAISIAVPSARLDELDPAALAARAVRAGGRVAARLSGAEFAGKEEGIR